MRILALIVLYVYHTQNTHEQQMQVNGEKENARKQNTQASPWRRTRSYRIESHTNSQNYIQIYFSSG